MARDCDTRTRAQRARAVQQEALRERLAAGGHLDHVIDILEDIRNLEGDLPDNHLARLKFVVDTKLKLVAKYLPDTKAVEVTGEAGGPLEQYTRTVIEFVGGLEAADGPEDTDALRLS